MRSRCWSPQLFGPNLILYICVFQKNPLWSFAWCTHTLLSTFLLGLIRKYNGWLSTRKGSSAFKLAPPTAKISLLNLIQIFLLKWSLPFWDSVVFIFCDFSLLCAVLFWWRKTAKNWIWTVNIPPKIFVDTRSMRLPRVYHQIIVYDLRSISET